MRVHKPSLCWSYFMSRHETLLQCTRLVLKQCVSKFSLLTNPLYWTGISRNTSLYDFYNNNFFVSENYFRSFHSLPIHYTCRMMALRTLGISLDASLDEFYNNHFFYSKKNFEMLPICLLTIVLIFSPMLF